jgi:anti-sigma factor RsiW
VNCREFKERVSAYVDGELASEAAEATAHAESCPRCARLAALEKQMKRRLAAAYVPAEPPAGLRRRVLRALPAAGSPRSFALPWIRRAWIPATAAALILVALLVALPGVGARDFDRALIEHHQRLAETPGRMKPCTCPLRSEKFFHGKIDAKIHVPRFPAEKINLKGIALCQVCDCKVACIVFEEGQDRISFFITERAHLPLEKLQEVLFKQHSFRVSTYEGFRALIWSHHGQNYSIVAKDSVPQKHLLELALSWQTD